MNDADQVFEIASGCSRAQVEKLAHAAFDLANDLRAGHAPRSAPGALVSFTDCGPAIVRAAAWAEVLRHMDRTGTDVFSREGFTGYKPLARAYGTVPGTRLMLGRKPFTFYTPPVCAGR